MCSICLLITKYYIYNQRLFEEKKINFYEYLIYLKYKLTMEHLQQPAVYIYSHGYVQLKKCYFPFHISITE